MKKNYLIICMVQVIIASTLLFPVTAHSQDLTAEQKERCQNNRNRIAELEGQSKTIAAELSKMWTNEEINKATDKMMFIRKLKNMKDGLPTLDENQTFKRIAREYNYYWDRDKVEDDYNYDAKKVYTALEKIIGAKIEKGKTEKSNRAALATQKNEIDKQIAQHRTNLVALGCDANNNTGNTPDITGSWKALKWSYEFTQNGKKFGWKITNDGAYGEKAEGEFLEGNRIKATWTNKNGKDSGEGTVKVKNGRVTQINWDNKVVFTRN